MSQPKTSAIIPIVYATDLAYMRYTLVSMVSALQYARRDTFYAFIVLVPQDSGIDQIDINERLNRFDNYSLRFIEMGNEFANIPMHISYITTPTFFRLCIPGLLEDYDKCIYLDGDTIVCEDLQSLYSLDLKDDYLGGVPAYGYYQKQDEHRKRLEISNDQPFQYINAGVLLMNLRKLREDKKEEQFIKLLEKDYASQDQDILNVACYGKIKLLPYRYNVMTPHTKWRLEDFSSDANPDEIISGRMYPAIIHYADRVKPWNDYSCSYSNYWLSAAMSGICWDLFPDIPILKNTPAAFAAIRKEAEDEKQRADKLKYDLDSKKKQVDRLQYDLDCVHASISFRIGRGVTYLPRKLRDLSAGDGNSDTNT